MKRATQSTSKPSLPKAPALTPLGYSTLRKMGMILFCLVWLVVISLLFGTVLFELKSHKARNAPEEHDIPQLQLSNFQFLTPLPVTNTNNDKDKDPPQNSPPPKIESNHNPGLFNVFINEAPTPTPIVTPTPPPPLSTPTPSPPPPPPPPIPPPKRRVPVIYPDNYGTSTFCPPRPPYKFLKFQQFSSTANCSEVNGTQKRIISPCEFHWEDLKKTAQNPPEKLTFVLVVHSDNDLVILRENFAASPMFHLEEKSIEHDVVIYDNRESKYWNELPYFNHAQLMVCF